MRVIGYAFDADLHCVACTCKAANAGQLRHEVRSVSGMASFTSTQHDVRNVTPDNIDQLRLVTRYGDMAHAVFSTDEIGDGGDFCGDCHAPLRE